MLRTIFAVLTAFFVLRTATAQDAASIAEIVPPLLEEYNVPGLAVAVIRDGEIALVRGFGSLRAGEKAPVGDRTVFQAASLSKPVVAYGTHLLVREGKLELDRPLSDYLETPYVPYLDDPRIVRITARIALSHTTGFPNWRPKKWTDDPELLEIEFDPGSRFQYSGEGYGYLQHVLEEVTGETLDVYLRRAVLTPLGMVDSSFVWEERFETVYASPHDGDGVAGEKWRPREAIAAGTLQTTAADYALFLRAVVTDGLLGKEATERMLTPHSTIDDELGWALGWGVETTEDGTVFWQWGDDGSFKALAAGSRARRTAVVVLTNAQRGLDVARPVVENVLGPPTFSRFQNGELPLTIQMEE